MTREREELLGQDKSGLTVTTSIVYWAVVEDVELDDLDGETHFNDYRDWCETVGARVIAGDSDEFDTWAEDVELVTEDHIEFYEEYFVHPPFLDDEGGDESVDKATNVVRSPIEGDAEVDGDRLEFTPPFTKEEASYLSPDDPELEADHERCDECAFYVEDGGCLLVRGEIDPEAYCENLYSNAAVTGHKHEDEVAEEVAIYGREFPWSEADVESFSQGVRDLLTTEVKEASSGESMESLSDNSVSKDIFGTEQTGVSGSIFVKDEDEWVPYEGPRGGDGWQNVSDPESVSYENEPPGSVPPPEKVADPTLDIDPMDVETNDYIRLEGEGGHFEDTAVEGIVESVDRYKDSVDIDFVDRPSVTITAADAENVEVLIDDDFDAEQYREQIQIEEDLYGKVEDGLEYQDWPDKDGPFSSQIGMDPQDVTSEVAAQFRRSKVDIEDQVLDHLGQVRDKVPRSVFDNESKDIIFSADGDTDVVHHELTHAIIDSFGYDTDNETNVFSTFYNGSLDNIEIGDSFYDVIEAQAESRINDTLAPLSGKKQEFRDQLKRAKNEFKDKEVTEDMFLLTGGDEDTPEEFDRLIDEINESWKTIYETDKDEDTTSAFIMKPYSGTNAHETFAMFNELMQGGSVNKKDLEIVFQFHESLLDAYLDVYEPASLQKQMLNEVWEEMQDEEVEFQVFDEKPFPDVEEMKV